MKTLSKGLKWLLPILVVGGLWMLADDRQEADRFEQSIRYVPGMRMNSDLAREPVAGMCSSLLRALLPACLQ
jgi:hypothetical protein